MDGPEISNKIKSAIKAKLVELGAYVDDELPDYIMVMVANKKSQKQMDHDLEIFLHNHTTAFTKWLFVVLDKLKKVTKAKKLASAKSDKKEKKEKKKKTKKVGEVKEGKVEKKGDPSDGSAPEKKKSSVVATGAEGEKVEKKKKEKKKKVKTAPVPPSSGPSAGPGEVKKSDPKPKVKPVKEGKATGEPVQVPDKQVKPKPVDPAKEAARKRSDRSRSPLPAKDKTTNADRPTTKRSPLKEKVGASKNVRKSGSEDRGGIEKFEKNEVKVKRRSISSDFSSFDEEERSEKHRRRSKEMIDSRQHRQRSFDRDRGRSRSPYRQNQHISPDRRGHHYPGQRNPLNVGRVRSPPAQYRNQRDDFRHRDQHDERHNRHGDFDRHIPQERRTSFDRQMSKDHYRERRMSQEHHRERRASQEHRRDRRASQERHRERTLSHRRDSSEERTRQPALMSSVGAVVNHDSDDEYNPLRMLKKSMASTVQVARPKPMASSAYSRNRDDKPVEVAAKSLVLRAVKEADNSIRKKQIEDMERDAQLEEIRKRREEKLALLLSKGIGKKRDARNNNSKSDVTGSGKGKVEHTKGAIELDAQNIKSDVRRRESDARKERVTQGDARKERVTQGDASREERSIRRVSFSEDLEDEELEAEELKMIKNKKNFVIEIKNRVEPKTTSKSLDEDLRVRLEKRRRHVVQRQTEKEVVVRERAESPPVKIIKIDEPKIEEARRPEPSLDEDKDLIEMRRRALESMARGRLQQQSQKKVIVPLNQDSSSDSSSSDDSSSDSSSDDDSSDVSLSSTENEDEKKKKDDPTFIVTLDGIDAAYFKSKARPSQTNSKLILMQNRYKKEDEDQLSPNKQDRGIDEPIVVEQRKTISVPVLAAVGGGSGRTDPKNNDSVYRAATSKKPEAKVAPLKPTPSSAVTVKVEKTDIKSLSTVETSKNEPPSKSEAPKKERKRIEPPEKEKPNVAALVNRVPEYAKPIRRGAPLQRVQSFEKGSSSLNPSPLVRPSQCKFWPNCMRGPQCLYYHPKTPPAITSSPLVPSTSVTQKYRWTSANAPI